ncbi:protein ARV1-like [Tetranychus urticae]|uniref:Protein ARV n=1 Tax=Tetranychus urticae TaxID=32264 RepID=T1KGN3_TETUR|nr:protein ARV1-like [Tetranychus urticae]
MLKSLPKGPYVCVNCGHQSNYSLVKVYGPDSKKYDHGGNLITDGIKNGDDYVDFKPQKSINPLNLKLNDCSECGKPVDYYLQMDSCFLILDAMLMKTSFFRHIIHNCQLSKSLPIKLFIVYSFCETYKEWSSQCTTQIAYAELESMFYTLFLKNIFFNLIFFLSIFIIFSLRSGNFYQRRLLSSLVISSFCKLYKLPVTLWPSESQEIVDLLLEINLFAGLVQCCSVAFHQQIGKISCSLNLLLGYLIVWTSKKLIDI